ncbi:hypothetical protein A2715_05035 [Candidatus Woesebacteria bacterium RIFCSPHIGHO2_01_FULL_39_32]|uniref:Uncharacterized protein n=1 Tax=Candidatus Woesebacteria bacterium RIFCSPLOWO2_01_FULL_39_25 TaxID=1802521 RepID=A0A1F8BLH1_9BACT|nr:MAG: hypothetical protein A2715_05035 [Candidatus Woesebacteria bacterium RIFCSPHIGHO2_01_FULL_39_32]OGM38489.1 MAG: hypothetical protein A3F01_03990 [Candidatus Woesebacteria bacterium RIFCSPHIGHO2_12_FULL_38_11]OGM64914.1 MAG: hypothetical protein A2893_04645 [Candidatus Woesebacteria bacterium RIFCSPLOWO2_01_FULL_39_25]
MKKIRSYRYPIFIFSLFVLTVLNIIKIVARSRFAVNIFPNLHYWLWTIILIEAVFVFNIKIKNVLKIALALTVVGGALSIFRIVIAENVLKFGFILWIVGYLFNLIEIVRKNEIN